MASKARPLLKILTVGPSVVFCHPMRWLSMYARGHPGMKPQRLWPAMCAFGALEALEPTGEARCLPVLLKAFQVWNLAGWEGLKWASHQEMTSLLQFIDVQIPVYLCVPPVVTQVNNGT